MTEQILDPQHVALSKAVSDDLTRMLASYREGEVDPMFIASIAIGWAVARLAEFSSPEVAIATLGQLQASCIQLHRRGAN